MSQQTAKHLAQLAKATRRLETKHELILNLKTLLDKIGATGQVVIGETELLNDLQGLLKTAFEIREALEQAKDTKKAISQLSELEALLSDVSWELAEKITNDLREKDKTQQEQLDKYEAEIRNWESQVGNFFAHINSATIARAPVMQETQEAKRLQGLVELAKRNWRDRKLEDLTESINQLKDSSKLQMLTTQVSDKIDQMKKFARQADLLLLQSPLVEQSYQYTVLLRTPSEPGTHGINIQAESTLVERDREYMRATIDKITDAINAGLVRQFSQESEVSSPPDSEVNEQARKVRPVDVNDKYPPSQNINYLIQDVGDLMYRLFMPERMQDYLNNTPCSITITTNDLELPWELMFYKDTFLCLDRPIARLPMGETFPRREKQLLPNSDKLRFLLIYSDTDPPSLPAAEKEIDWIKNGLEKDWKEQIKIDVLKQKEVQGHMLNNMLRSGTYDVIHYAGHARFDENKPELSGLLLNDNEVFFAQKFRRLLEGRPLVFLNACESARCANEQKPQKIEQYLLKESAEGLSKAVIYGGALCCIGALWPIYDRPAAEFALQYYKKVLEGYMIGEAMRQARIQSKKAYPDQITWAAFVLYGDPTYRLVTKY